jgi:hypothetical protein
VDDFARLPARERSDLFNEASARRGLAPAILEKDFWVCWMLKRLFSGAVEGPALIFKGGTSLSKVYAAIRRFSEDIDLSFNRRDLGFDDDALSGLSKKKIEERVEKLEQDVIRHIEERFLPQLRAAIAELLGSPDRAGWVLDRDPNDRQGLIFTYPPSLSSGSYSGLDYVRPVVRLELGARSDHWPTESRRVKPYATEDFETVFAKPECEVTVLGAERTFWEKATILHATYHEPATRPFRDRWSRHYYDLALLADTEQGRKALTQPELLASVAQHKMTFFPAAWASYDTAKPGSLKLVPRDDQMESLKRDYQKMAPMIFDTPPPALEKLIARIADVEARFNATTS